MCRTGGASRLTAFLIFHDVDNDDDDRKHVKESGDNIRKSVAHIEHGDALVVWYHAIAAPSVSPSKRSLTLDNSHRSQG
jgi:hypothetical protein